MPLCMRVCLESDFFQGFLFFLSFHGLFYTTLPDRSVDPSPEMLPSFVC
jgi:hypothetical protein